MRRRLRRLRALIIKEWWSILRDPAAVGIAMVGPVLLLILFVYGVSLNTERVSVGIVIEQSTPEARDLAGAFRNARYFRPVFFQERLPAEQALSVGKVGGVVVLAGNFSRAALADGEAPVQVLVDGVDGRTGRTVATYVEGAVAKWLSQRVLTRQLTMAPGVQVASRVWFNPGLESRYFIAPGVIALIMMVTGTLLAALVVASEWEGGTMEAVLATPAMPSELLLAKIVSYVGLGIAGVGLAVALAVTVIGIPFRGSYLVLAAAASLFMLAALSMGFVVSGATKNRVSAGRLALTAGYLPTIMLSGLLFDLQNAPAPIQWISHLVPARYFVSILHSLFLVGNVWGVILPNLAGMGLLAFSLLALAVRLNRKRLG